MSRKHMTRPACAAALAVAAALGASACRSPTQGEVPGTVVEAQRAKQSIAEARCDLAGRCDHIGPGRTYADRDTCMAAIEQAWHGELDPSSCPGGVDAGKLDDCLATIRDTKCGSAMDQVGTNVACRASGLCKR